MPLDSYFYCFHFLEKVSYFLAILCLWIVEMFVFLLAVNGILCRF